MTHELLTKYLDGLCTGEEQQEVEAWFRQKWASAEGPLPAADTQAVWESLRQELGMASPRAKVVTLRRRARLLVAAAAVLLAVVSGFVFWYRPAAPNNQVAVTRPLLPMVEWAGQENTGKSVRRSQLEDGTWVALAPGAVIRYRKGFEPNRRQVQLTGKATFKVAKDWQRPFTVFCDSVPTTALGTEFMVWGSAGRVTVRLFEGKVMVKGVVLSPGEELRYDLATAKASVRVFDDAAGQPAVESGANAALSFNNAPLHKVLDQLAAHYHVTISYDEQELRGFHFTGTVGRQDSLPLLLNLVARMNNLDVLPEADGFRIRQAHRP